MLRLCLASGLHGRSGPHPQMINALSLIHPGSVVFMQRLIYVRTYLFIYVRFGARRARWSARGRDH